MNELYYIQNLAKARFLDRTYLYGHLIFLSTVILFSQILQASESAQIVTSTPSTLAVHAEINPEKLTSYISENNEISYYQTVVVAVPFDGDVSLASLQLGNQKLFQKKSQPNLSLSEKNIIEFSEPLIVRGQKYVTVYIFPVTFSGVYETVDFTLSFTGTINSQKSALVDSPFDRMLKSSVLNYQQSALFAKENYKAKSANIASGPFSQTNEWIKIEVNQNGLYKVSGAQLDASGITVTGSVSSSIHLYNGGGQQLPVPNEIARPEFQEVAIKVVDGGDNVFNSNDYILFYGESVNRWIYDTSGVSYHNHSYAETNIYWLETSSLSNGLRMTSVNASQNGTISQTIDRFTKRVHVEQNHMLRRWSDNKINDYYRWFWYDSRELSFFASTENIVPNDTVDVTLVGITSDTTGASDDIGGIDFYVNNTKGIDKNCVTNGGCTYRSASFVDGVNNIDLFLMYFTISPPYFDYLELSYTSFNQAVQNQLDITLGQMSGNTEIEVVNNFSSNPMILDISNPLIPRELTLPSFSAGSFSFYDTLSTSKYNRYFLSPPAQALAPLSVSAETTKDLYVSNTQTDMIVISPRFMQSALSELKSYRTSQGYATQLVSVEDIMDNFSFGLYDPTAIRDFLKNAYETYPDPKPSAVLFIGDANYDYLNNLSTGMPNFVPPFIHQTDQTSSDDNYVYFGDFGILDSDTTYDTSQVTFDRGFDMMTARWPVRTSSDINSIINKIKGYESTTDFGSWRNHVTLVADDEYGSLDNEYFHTTQIEQLEQYHLPVTFTRDKIYLWEYPFVNGEKPEVNSKIVNAFNNGTLLVNYVGHGNPDVWAHENVFNRAGDLPKLHNEFKLPLVIAASCAIGFYDDPLREGMAEELLSMSAGGAIGVISATRLVYSSDNAQFNRKIYDLLFSGDSLSICEALYAAKVERQYTGGIPVPKTNDRNYLFFGSPFVKLAQPKYQIEFTTSPDSLVALGKAVVAGTVLNDNGSQVLENGTVDINVYDSKRNKTYQLKNVNGQVTTEVDYAVTGPSIFRGSASVTNGQFSFEFVPPLDIGFGGKSAQVSLYAQFETVDASGIIDSISISDSISVTADSLGPEIEVAFTNHPNFVSGDLINQGETMILKISDQSGINLAGGLGHGITLEIDNQSENLQNLTSYFSYEQDSFDKGALEFPIEGLSDGVHSFKIKAWDNANNFAKTEFDVEIKSSTKLEIVNLLNYPNPMRESTRFSFNLTQSVDNFELSIFTLSGKKIKTFSRQYLEPSYFDDIVWYGDDVDGDRVATEVYIYKATAYPSDGSEKVESFGKIILVN